ncbi:50S ribosomal protein L11 methyltransferase [Prochlorococcus marinus]|uniref:Ribosomal protein L11 methyltransferase n=1 Tax=Prochlorococcus marinus (strain MIT 9211) TaxID=93059 RepID=A9BBX7_PROM4|nr:50S ribosomal protein L11 methyltransferase [Prochlorococcus marinus]ABX09339.1 putative methyltransferase for Ribosomal protein L11 [Prochlorococcus marinus str. MIT 9211]
MIDFRNIFWWRLKLPVPHELEESMIWKLQHLSIKSYAIEIDPKNNSRSFFYIWLISSEWPKYQREQLINCFKPLARTFDKTLEQVTWEKVDDEDWSSSWKKYWGPAPVGKRLLILPAWMDLPASYSERIVVKLDPGAAFGTGDHPTTKLCLEAIERQRPKDLRIVDIGCGSGVLGLAALRLGAKEVIGVDIDPLAIGSAQRNAFLNDFDENSFRTFHGSIDTVHNELQGAKADLLLCNILAPVIKTLGEDFDRVISPQGNALISGLLVEQMQDITKFLVDLGWNFIASYQQDNWALIQLSKSSRH